MRMRLTTFRLKRVQKRSENDGAVEQDPANAGQVDVLVALDNLLLRNVHLDINNVHYGDSDVKGFDCR